MAERPQLRRLVLDLSAPGPVIPSSAVTALDAADRGRLSGAGDSPRIFVCYLPHIQQLAAFEHWLLQP